MANFLKGILKFIATLAAMLFVITLVLSFFLYSVENSAFNAETYKKALKDEGIYERLPAVLGDQLVLMAAGQDCEANPVTCGFEERSPALESCLEDALGSEAYQTLAFNERTPTDAEIARMTPCFDAHGYPELEGEGNEQLALFKNLTAKDWEILLTALLPQSELEAFSEESMDALFDFLNGNAESVQISTYRLKEQLLSEKGADAVFAFLAAQPACTLEDMFDIATTGELVFCNPAEESLILVRPLIEAQLKVFAEKIPDTQTFLQNANSNSQFLEVQSIRVFIRLSPLVPLGLLFLITMLVVRSLQSWLRWWGLPMLIAGGLGLILSLLTGPILRSAFNIIFLDRIPIGVSGSVIDLGYDLFISIAHNFVENMALYSLITAILGSGMLLGAFFAKRKENI
ncbi:MAG: hypothetical protein HN855_04575 [Anaerolineae bacterium]|jgi:hypothetical protein|nr:hypothetical protein [Anaerolineae bacterium]MBT7070370.1 hypothetical protein [Anaerolineae bacterium]MBT7324412.1 hypothetical protein [Anaerolineae bacterium]